MLKHPEAWPIPDARNEQMNIQNSKNKKRIEKIAREFKDVVEHPPVFDPFSPAGSEKWREWSDRCRNYEIILTDYGVDL